MSPFVALLVRMDQERIAMQLKAQQSALDEAIAKGAQGFFMLDGRIKRAYHIGNHWLYLSETKVGEEVPPGTEVHTKEGVVRI